LHHRGRSLYVLDFPHLFLEAQEIDDLLLEDRQGGSLFPDIEGAGLRIPGKIVHLSFEARRELGEFLDLIG
jgi:hypothetical protein